MIDLINNWAQGWADYFSLVLVQNTLFLGSRSPNDVGIMSTAGDD